MATLSIKTLCSSCTHMVLNGVACDWQPEECPFLEKKPVTTKATPTSACNYSQLVLEASGEFDAIRSNN